MTMHDTIPQAAQYGDTCWIVVLASDEKMRFYADNFQVTEAGALIVYGKDPATKTQTTLMVIAPGEWRVIAQQEAQL
jgi:sarcosine oxidase gamma subunit